MTKTITTEIIIDTTPKKLWKILTDFSDFPSWNPFIVKILGKAFLSQVLSIWISPPGGSKMRFRPEIISLIPNKELIWKGKFLLPGLFGGEHRFFIEDLGGSVKFTHEEVFSGILVHLFPKSIYQKTEDGFKQMNEALKKQCE
jgi:hypothetical protein